VGRARCLAAARYRPGVGAGRGGVGLRGAGTRAPAAPRLFSNRSVPRGVEAAAGAAAEAAAEAAGARAAAERDLEWRCCRAERERVLHVRAALAGSARRSEGSGRVAPAMHHHGQWRGGGRPGPPGYAPQPPQHAYDLQQRLQQVVDTRDAVTGCSRVMLQHTEGRDSRAHAIRQWKDVVEGVIHDKVVGKALALLYVINDIVQCPHHGYRWQEDLGPHLCDVLPKALACARELRAHEIHQKMARMPNIWHERRVLPSNIAERLVDYSYDSTQELERGPMPSHTPRHNPTPAPLPLAAHPAPPLARTSQSAPHHLPHPRNPPLAQAAPPHPPPFGHTSHAPRPAPCDTAQAHSAPLARPAIPPHFSGSGAAQTHPARVGPDPKQVELEQARFDIDEAVNLMGLVKKCVLERKLQIFEQTHAGKAFPRNFPLCPRAPV